jgi:hypothetical protein
MVFPAGGQKGVQRGSKGGQKGLRRGSKGGQKGVKRGSEGGQKGVKFETLSRTALLTNLNLKKLKTEN